MNGTIPPLPERWMDMSKSLIIPQFQNIPPCKENHFRKEWFIESPPSMQSNFHHVITILPINLQIIPHTDTEIAVEKKMVSVLKSPSWTEYTFRPIIDPPMPTLNHVLGVNPVHYDHPGKHFDRHGASALPNPPQNGICHHCPKIELLYLLNSSHIIVSWNLKTSCTQNSLRTREISQYKPMQNLIIIYCSKSLKLQFDIAY